MALQIDVVSDIVCPWCFIAKRGLRAALDRVQGPSIVRWHPRQLYPDVPLEGTDLVKYLETRFGNMPAVYAAMDQLQAAGLNLGIRFDFSRINKLPNTLDAHRLIFSAGTQQQDALVENLFSGFFEHGLDLSRREVLLELAVQSGLQEDLAKQALDNSRTLEGVLAEQQRMQQLGLEGLPNFLLNERLSVVGAYDEDTLLRAFDIALFGPAQADAAAPTLH